MSKKRNKFRNELRESESFESPVKDETVEELVQESTKAEITRFVVVIKGLSKNKQVVSSETYYPSSDEVEQIKSIIKN